jgi:Mce-associated membrane protein
VTALLLLASAALAFLAHRAQQVEAARRAAVSSAEHRLPALLSYRHDRLDRDLARAVDQTTGSFHDEYQELVTRTVRPTAERREVDTTATVSGAGVVRASDDRVVVLVFLTQSTVTAGDAPVVSGSRVEVTLQRVGDDWLLSALEPV